MFNKFNTIIIIIACYAAGITLGESTNYEARSNVVKLYRKIVDKKDFNNDISLSIDRIDYTKVYENLEIAPFVNYTLTDIKNPVFDLKPWRDENTIAYLVSLQEKSVLASKEELPDIFGEAYYLLRTINNPINWIPDDIQELSIKVNKKEVTINDLFTNKDSMLDGSKDSSTCIGIDSKLYKPLFTGLTTRNLLRRLNLDYRTVVSSLGLIYEKDDDSIVTVSEEALDSIATSRKIALCNLDFMFLDILAYGGRNRNAIEVGMRRIFAREDSDANYDEFSMKSTQNASFQKAPIGDISIKSNDSMDEQLNAQSEKNAPMNSKQLTENAATQPEEQLQIDVQPQEELTDAVNPLMNKFSNSLHQAKFKEEELKKYETSMNDAQEQSQGGPQGNPQEQSQGGPLGGPQEQSQGGAQGNPQEQSQGGAQNGLQEQSQGGAQNGPQGGSQAQPQPEYFPNRPLYTPEELQQLSAAHEQQVMKSANFNNNIPQNIEDQLPIGANPTVQDNMQPIETTEPEQVQEEHSEEPVEVDFEEKFPEATQENSTTEDTQDNVTTEGTQDNATTEGTQENTVEIEDENLSEKGADNTDKLEKGGFFSLFSKKENSAQSVAINVLSTCTLIAVSSALTYIL